MGASLWVWVVLRAWSKTREARVDRTQREILIGDEKIQIDYKIEEDSQNEDEGISWLEGILGSLSEVEKTETYELDCQSWCNRQHWGQDKAQLQENMDEDHPPNKKK